MYQFGLFGLIISHCNAMSKGEHSLCDVFINVAKYDFVVFYFLCIRTHLKFYTTKVGHLQHFI